MLSTMELTFSNCGVEKTLESPLDSKIKPVKLEVNPEYSLEGMMLKLKFQPFGHLVKSTGKTMMLEKIEGMGRRGRQGMSWLDGIISSMDMSLSEL